MRVSAAWLIVAPDDSTNTTRLMSPAGNRSTCGLLAKIASVCCKSLGPNDWQKLLAAGNGA